jgi:hypothetical protein
VAVGIIVITAIVISFNYNYYKFNDTSSSLSSLAQQQKISQTITEQPSLLGPGKNTLKVENFVAPGSLSSPTSMAFIDASNLLVLQKDGQLRLISNGILQRKPILTIQVDMQANVDY